MVTGSLAPSLVLPLLCTLEEKDEVVVSGMENLIAVVLEINSPEIRLL